MTSNLRVTLALAGALVLAASAAMAGDVKPKADTPAAAEKIPGCLTHTGSRIPNPRSNCIGVGHSFTQDDISRTGATSAGGALRLMDPSLTIHH